RAHDGQTVCNNLVDDIAFAAERLHAIWICFLDIVEPFEQAELDIPSCFFARRREVHHARQSNGLSIESNAMLGSGFVSNRPIGGQRTKTITLRGGQTKQTKAMLARQFGSGRRKRAGDTNFRVWLREWQQVQRRVLQGEPLALVRHPLASEQPE